MAAGHHPLGMEEDDVQVLVPGGACPEPRPARRRGRRLRRGLVAAVGTVSAVAVMCATVAVVLAAARKRTVVRLGATSQLNADDGGMHWGSCRGQGGLRIRSAESLCCSLGVAHHCVTVLELDQDSVAMVEQYGEGDIVRSAVSCYLWRNTTFSASRLAATSAICNDGYWTSASRRPAAGWLGAYAPLGYGDERHYDATLGGLEKWTTSYLEEFPKYDSLSTNCQKYNIGVYNAVTHSTRQEDQKVLTAFGSLLAGGIKGSLANAAVLD